DKYASIVLGSLDEYQNRVDIFLIEFKEHIDDKTRTMLHLFRAVMELSWENARVHDERQSIIEKWERLEAANKAGALAREFAHETQQFVNSSKVLIAKDPINVDNLRENLDRLEDLSKNLLKKTGISYQKELCGVNDIIWDTLRTYGLRKKGSYEIQGHKINLKLDHRLRQKGKPAYLVDVDPNAIISCLRNLISNAIEQYKFINKKGPIDILTELNKSSSVDIIVQDYAGGINPEILPNMIWDAWVSR
ncbi:unnamed protein product, partial [marine sediment metagenome]